MFSFVCLCALFVCFDCGRGSRVVPPLSTKFTCVMSGTVSLDSRLEFCVRMFFDLIKPLYAKSRSSRLVSFLGQAATPRC